MSGMFIHDPSSITREDLDRVWEGEGRDLPAADGKAREPKAWVQRAGEKLILKVPGTASSLPGRSFGWFDFNSEQHDSRLFPNDHALTLTSNMQHRRMFSVLAEFVLSHITPETANPAEAVAEGLSHWRKYLRTYRDPGKEGWGLHGELLTLEQLITSFGPRAVAWWTGPNMSPKDFTIGESGFGLEVKTCGENSTSVRVHGASQLEPEGRLLIVRMRRAEGGETPAAVIVRIRKKLSGQPEADTFEQLLTKAGFEDGEEAYPAAIARIQVEDLRRLPQITLPKEPKDAARISRLQFHLDVANIITEVPLNKLGLYLQDSVDDSE